MRRQLYILVAVGVILLIGLTLLLTQKKPTLRVPQGYLIKEADISLTKGDLIGARALLKQALEETEDLKTLENLKSKIEDLNIRILFSPLIEVCSTEYVVKPKDSIVKIAKEFGTTVELIKRANSLETDIIRPQQRLKVNSCVFSLVIDKSQNRLFLKQKDNVIKTYSVSTGKDNSTPTGKFKIVNKLKNPAWFKAGAVVPPDSPDNILGARWMGLDVEGYGIHGNRDVNEIGRQVTQGCIRMINQDAEELYSIVPIGTEVIIVD